MSSLTEKLAATTFGKYLEARGWAKVSSLPDGLHKADLSVITKIGVSVPDLVKKLVSVYLSGDLLMVYVKISGSGIWRKRTDQAIADIPGVAADSLKAEEVGQEVKRDLTWIIVGVGAAVIGLAGIIFWESRQ